MVGGKLKSDELKHIVSMIPYHHYENEYFQRVYFDKEMYFRILVYPKNRYAWRHYNIIISFHPDSPPPLAVNILQLIGKDRIIIKRIDKAFDIQNEFSDTFILPVGTRTKQAYIKGSEYFGSISSDFIIARYNKSLQLEQKKGFVGVPSTTRVEYRIKKQNRKLKRLNDFDVTFYMPLNDYRVLPFISKVEASKIRKDLYDVSSGRKKWSYLTSQRKKAIREAVNPHLINPFEYIHVPNMDTATYLPECLQLLLIS